MKTYHKVNSIIRHVTLLSMTYKESNLRSSFFHVVPPTTLNYSPKSNIVYLRLAKNENPTEFAQVSTIRYTDTDHRIPSLIFVKDF